MLQDSVSRGTASSSLFQAKRPSTTGAVEMTNSWGLTDRLGWPLKTFNSFWPMVSLPAGSGAIAAAGAIVGSGIAVGAP